jgi:hypothetical protein
VPARLGLKLGGKEKVKKGKRQNEEGIKELGVIDGSR